MAFECSIGEAAMLRIVAELTGIPASVLASLRPGPNGEPPTHVVVAREHPDTDAMMDALNDAIGNGEGRIYQRDLHALWRAMLAAAQEPGHD